MNIRLCEMTKELSRQYHKYFTNRFILQHDRQIDSSKLLVSFHCCVAVFFTIDIRLKFAHIHKQSRIQFKVLIKNIDWDKRHCAFGISMRSDEYKNKGYGTKAELLMLEYVFNELGMETVFADAILKNVRSQHVLKKVGFIETHNDDIFYYYRCDKDNWNRLKQQRMLWIGSIIA